jgi:NADH-quinone oxidoreductase subunit C
MTPQDLARLLQEKFGSLLAPPVEFRGEVTLGVCDSERIAEVCAFAKTELDCDYLVDISSVDHYGDDPRFAVVYELYGYGHRCHLRLKTAVSEEKAALPSVTSVWRTADWHEREIYDMMGLRFRGHPDLRRILMWEGYPHHPLRKDFPVGGKPTEVPGVAFTQAAPVEGGPFVTAPGGRDAIEREPRVKSEATPD